MKNYLKFISYLAAFFILATSAGELAAAPPYAAEGRRGRLTIDYNSKIDFVAEGRKFLNKGDIKEALYNAVYAVDGGRDPYDSYLLLADIYRASGDLKSEAYSLEYAVKHSPNDRLRGEAQRRLEKVRNDIKNRVIRQAAAEVVQTPESVNRILRLGHAFERFDSSEKALTQYDYADNLSGGLKSPKYAAIRLLLKEGRRRDAADAARKYFALSASDTAMVYLLAYNGFNVEEIKGLGYDGGGGFDARRYNRTYADYHYELGYNYYLDEKLDKAKTSILYALSYFKSNPRAHLTLGEIFYRKGMFREAGFHYNIASEFMPANYEVSLKMAKSFVLSRQYERARVVLKELLKTNPESAEYALWLEKTGLTRAQVERLGYTDPRSPFYKKKRPAKNQTPDPRQLPDGPENLLKRPPGPGAPFYQAPSTPATPAINLQL